MKRVDRAARPPALAAALLLAATAILPASILPAEAQTAARPPAGQAAKGDAARKEAAALPGGASSLQESFEDWTVVCALPGGHKVCSLSQTQANQQTQQRVLAVELTAGNDGSLTGVLAMPFGLALEKGVTLTIGDATAGLTLPFQTCLPVGCIVPLRLDTPTLAQMRAAKQIKLTAHAADTPQPVSFSISLKGFAPAMDRVKTLL